jgi:SH3-like domain-containing protein
MLRLFQAAAAAVFLAQAPLPVAADPVQTGAEHCVVNVRSDDTLNLRAGPGPGHSIRSRFPYPQCGIIVTGACAGSWCPAEDGHNSGWVHRHYIASVSEPTHCLSPLAQPKSVALRAWPADTSRVLVQLAPRSCGIALLPHATKGWQKIRQDGWEGWVRQSDLQSQGNGAR